MPRFINFDTLITLPSNRKRKVKNIACCSDTANKVTPASTTIPMISEFLAVAEERPGRWRAALWGV